MESEAVVAGADTRDALQVGTVRAAAASAFFLAAPVLAAFFGMSAMTEDHLGVDLGGLAPWVLLASAGMCGIAGAAGYRSGSAPATTTKLLGLVTLALAAFVATGDEAAVTLLGAVSTVALGWTLAQLAATARRAVVARSAAAAGGIVVAAGIAGAVGALHLAAVASGNGLLAAARWSVVYVLAGTAAAVAAMRRAPADEARATARDIDRLAERRTSGRRRWAPLRVDGLTVEFGGRRILDAVDLEVAAGQLVALVGANGSGKSTLLRAVAGFVEPRGGRISVAGVDITGLRPDERAAAGVALVNGGRPVFPDLTVLENLRVGAYLTHRTAASFAEATERILEIVPVLRGRLDTPAGVLSGGEQRHLAVAQSLFRRPTVLLADELTLGLDRASQATVHGLLRTIADDGIAVVVVDHDLDRLVPVADVVAAIHEGKLTRFDSTAAFTSVGQGLLEAQFLARSSS